MIDRWILRGGLAALLAVAVSAVGTSTASAQPAGSLYVAQAGAGSLRKTDGRWQLVLRRVSPRVTRFADRPARSGGSLPLRRFVSDWRAAFGDDAPNAALEIAGAPASRDVVLLELGRPRLDRRHHRVVMQAEPLRRIDRTGTALGALSKRSDRGARGRFGRASLFVDDGGPPNLLVVTVANLSAFDPLVVVLPPRTGFAFPPNATTVSVAINMQWSVTLKQYPTEQVQQLNAECLSAGCAGSGTVGVDAPTDQPLYVVVQTPDAGVVTASWAGGKPVTLPPASGGEVVSLPPAAS